jgi:hypothetical protein
LLRPESPTKVGGSGRGWGIWRVKILKRLKKRRKRKGKKRRRRKKKKKNNEKWGSVPKWASLTAFLPGPAPRAATMAKY